MIAGPSGGVLGDGGRKVSRDLLDRHPDIARAFIQAGQHPRAGHDRSRWPTVDWASYRARVGVCQSRGPWRIGMIEAADGDVTDWAIAAAAMPRTPPGWYTSLEHRDRGLVMSDIPAEIAGALPFLDWTAAHPGCRVLIGGLGLGIIPAWLLRHTQVGRVDVVETDPDVLALITEDWCARDEWAADPRLHIHQGDILTWKPAIDRWDAAWFDIWDTVAPDNLPSMHRLTRRFARRAGRVWCWERAECEAMRARGQTLPNCLFISDTGH